MESDVGGQFNDDWGVELRDIAVSRKQGRTETWSMSLKELSIRNSEKLGRDLVPVMGLSGAEKVL